jgi:hypothetical protein
VSAKEPPVLIELNCPLTLSPCANYCRAQRSGTTAQTFDILSADVTPCGWVGHPLIPNDTVGQRCVEPFAKWSVNVHKDPRDMLLQRSEAMEDMRTFKGNKQGRRGEGRDS